MSDGFHFGAWAHPLLKGELIESPEQIEAGVKRLADAGLELIFPRVKAHESGYADFRSDVADTAPNYPDWDPLKVLAETATRYGMRVHPYFNVFTEGPHSALLRESPEVAVVDDSLGRYQGRTTWVCACRPEVQEYQFALYKSLVDRYPIHGLGLDYIRTGGVCRCDYCKEQMAGRGIDITDLGKDVRGGAGSKEAGYAEWTEWRCERVTSFVRRMREMTRSKNIELSASVFADVPASCYDQGQDWSAWAKEGLIDIMSPMNYDNSARFMGMRTRQHVALVEGSCQIWEGVGKESSRSTLSTEALVEQIKTVKEQGGQGINIFAHAAITDEDLAAIKSLRDSGF